MSSISAASINVSDFHEAENDDIINGMVDFSGRAAIKSQTGYWRSACYIIGVGAAERFAYYGIASNLITYLTGPLRQPTAAAAASINIWTGTGMLVPLLGAFVADSFLGRYWTIVFSALLYILALAMLTASALLNCEEVSRFNSRSPSQLELLFFFMSLYLMALGQGMQKPCVLAFGADQFDDEDPEELRGRSSYFNWWYFSICAGPLAALLALNYIQDNVSWVVGFAIPCIAMAVALIIFLLGTKKYRYNVKASGKCALSRVSHVFFKAATNRRVVRESNAYDEENNDSNSNSHQRFQNFKFLNKALLETDGSLEHNEVCSVHEVEEVKSLLNLIPVWATSLPFAIALAQPSTLFTEQGITLDRSITTGFKIPAASLQYTIGISIIFLIPIYDRIFVPFTRLITGIPSGITKLQRVGTGMVLITLCMITAAFVDKKRVNVALVHGLADMPNKTLPMSFWWLIPQFILFGMAEVFTVIGLQEMFYDQVPCDLKSVGLSLFMSIIGIGNFLSSFLICMIDRLSGEGGWFLDNTNRAHFDYFYWLLAGLNAAGFLGLVCVSRSFICKSNIRSVG